MVAALSVLLAVSVLLLAIPWNASLLELLRHFQLWRAAIAAVLLATNWTAYVYAVVAGALGVDYPGRRSFPAIVRS